MQTGEMLSPAVVAMPTQEELILTLMKVNVSEPESI